MPVFERTLVLPRQPAAVFDLLIQPARMIQAMPPELSLRLIESPERLFLGARVVVSGRRWGVPHRVTTEVTAFESCQLLVEEQKQGPLRRWQMTQRFEAHELGTLLTSRVDFEPPGGILGLTVTAATVQRELEWVLDYRAELLLRTFDQTGHA
jgi:ligand-binding SRPBCC domain-containing protein